MMLEQASGVIVHVTSIQLEAAVGLVEDIARKSHTDYEGARKVLTSPPGGIAIGRPAKPREVADPDRLASPRAASVNGAEFVIDGTVPIACSQSQIAACGPLATFHCSAMTCGFRGRADSRV
jgi:hypothetical protein